MLIIMLFKKLNNKYHPKLLLIKILLWILHKGSRLCLNKVLSYKEVLIKLRIMQLNQ
jgi:hypothetical protein